MVAAMLVTTFGFLNGQHIKKTGISREVSTRDCIWGIYTFFPFKALLKLKKLIKKL